MPWCCWCLSVRWPVECPIILHYITQRAPKSKLKCKWTNLAINQSDFRPTSGAATEQIEWTRLQVLGFVFQDAGGGPHKTGTSDEYRNDCHGGMANECRYSSGDHRRCLLPKNKWKEGRKTTMRLGYWSLAGDGMGRRRDLPVLFLKPNMFLLPAPTPPPISLDSLLFFQAYYRHLKGLSPLQVSLSLSLFPLSVSYGFAADHRAGCGPRVLGILSKGWEGSSGNGERRRPSKERCSRAFPHVISSAS